jgi:hypothetical protein
MSQDQLADLIEKYKQEISRWTAEEIASRQVGAYQQYSIDQLSKFYLPTVEMLARYYRSNDVTEWREYIVRVAEDRRRQGLAPDAVFIAAAVLGAMIKKMVDRELPGAANQATRERYYRRLDGTTNLSKATILKANLNVTKD